VVRCVMRSATSTVPSASALADPVRKTSPPGMTEVDVLDGGRAVAQAGELRPAGEAAGLTLGPLAVDQDADTILEGQVGK
jgi:hypothetical protein